MSQRARTCLTLAFLALLAAGCGGAPVASRPPAPAVTTTPTQAAVATVTPAPPTAAPTQLGPHRSLVGLGDSVPGGLKCNDPCRSYVLSFGELAAATLGEAVVTTNLATNDGLESDKLLGRVQKDASYRTAIAAADIITLQVGFNDWQGPCNFENHSTCLPLGIGRVRPNVEGILAEIAALRAGKPTAIRVVTYYNGFLGNKLTPSIWGFAARPADIASFDKDFRAELADFNAMLCDLAAAHEALCVEVGAAFNGRKLDAPAEAGLINSDGIHGLAAGQMLIATLLDEAGYAPLR